MTGMPVQTCLSGMPVQTCLSGMPDSVWPALAARWCAILADMASVIIILTMSFSYVSFK